MGSGNFPEVNGAFSTLWHQLCFVASCKRLSGGTRRAGAGWEGDGICALQGSGEHNKVCFSLWFLVWHSICNSACSHLPHLVFRWVNMTKFYAIFEDVGDRFPLCFYTCWTWKKENSQFTFRLNRQICCVLAPCSAAYSPAKNIFAYLAGKISLYQLTTDPGSPLLF